jgi:hypothetical protein
MMVSRWLKLAACVAPAALVVGCATPPKPYDYTAFNAAKPRSIVVLPPLNNSPDVKAGPSVYAQVTYPLAEAGYYVMPVALVEETFKQNGLTTVADIHAVDAARLKQVFGADAALYVTISNYGATYAVVNSVVVVTANARLVDLKTGAVLWEGTASANNDAGNNSGGGLAGLLVAAVVKQILNSTMDVSHVVAGAASNRLLSAGQPNGILYGPRSVLYQSR